MKLEGRTLTGMAFSLSSGRAVWDRAGTIKGLPPTDVIWLDDYLPAGATTDGVNEDWKWVNNLPRPFSGLFAWQSENYCRNRLGRNEALGKIDRAKMNGSVFKALKPGGVYFIYDHNAREGAGANDAKTYRVHNKLGEPCARCGTPLARVDFEEHTIFYCPQCQTEGRVLKDRRMSRLLK